MPPSEQAHSSDSGQARWSALSQSKWFAEEVQPHEPALRAYLQARFPSLSDHDDIVQESYVRLLRAQTAGHVRYARALLFTTARNAALDLFRRRRVVPMEAVTDFKELSVLEEQPGVAERADQQYELEVLADAVRALPDRCRQVIMLRCLDGLAYKEIATQVGISPETVKVHMAKGMRRCAAFFAERGLMEANPSPSRETVEQENNRPVASHASAKTNQSEGGHTAKRESLRLNGHGSPKSLGNIPRSTTLATGQHRPVAPGETSA